MHVRELPASFYCLIMEESGMNTIATEWYINDVPITDFPGATDFSMIEPEEENTNLTIVSLQFLNSSVTFLEIFCRSELFPDVTYGYFQIGE